MPCLDMWQDCQSTLQHTRPCCAKSSYQLVNHQTLRGNVHQVDHVPNGPTNSAATTTFPLLLVAVTRERRYGPRRPRVNDDDASCAANAIDWYILPAGPTAANMLQWCADNRSDIETYRLMPNRFTDPTPHRHIHTHTQWILLKQETVSGNGICWAIRKSALCSSQITMSVPHHWTFYRPDAPPATQPTASKYWRQNPTPHTTSIIRYR